MEHYYANPDVNLLTLPPDTDSWIVTTLNPAIGMLRLILNTNYIYIELAMISVLVGASQPKVDRP